LYQKMLDSVVGVDYLIGMPNTKLVVTEQPESTLWVANFTLDDYNQITWHPAKRVESEKAVVVMRYENQCVRREVTLKKMDDQIIIPIALPHMSLVQIRL